MMRVGLELSGTKQAVDHIRALRVQHEQAYRAAVFLFAQEVMTSALRLCPVDTGHLRKSRYVLRPEVSGDRFTITMGFSADYALWVHEINKRYIVGQWKFLSTAVAQHAPTALNRIAKLTAAGAAGGLTPENVPAVHPTEPPTGERPVVRHSRETRAKRAAAYARRFNPRAEREYRAMVEGLRRGVRPTRGS